MSKDINEKTRNDNVVKSTKDENKTTGNLETRSGSTNYAWTEAGATWWIQEGWTDASNDVRNEIGPSVSVDQVLTDTQLVSLHNFWQGYPNYGTSDYDIFLSDMVDQNYYLYSYTDGGDEPEPVPIDDGQATFTITGNAVVGGTLFVVESQSDPDGGVQNISYHWSRLESEVQIAIDNNFNNYNIIDDDEGKSIFCQIEYVDGEGHLRIVDAVNSSTGENYVEVPFSDDGPATFTISGDAVVGGTLTVVESEPDPDNMTSLNLDSDDILFWWKDSNNNILQQGTGPLGTVSYTITDDDDGKTIYCQIQYLDDEGHIHTVNSDSVDVSANNEPEPESSTGRALIITGVFDGPLSPGGAPRGIELYAIQNIADLSDYGVGSANNGGGTDGQEFVLSGSASAGDYIYIVAAGQDDKFMTYFDRSDDGDAPNFETNAAAINGDDAIELFENNEVIDTFGDVNVDGSGQPWD